MSDLKRCPFCGDEVEIVPTGLYHWKYAIRHKSKTECILDANAFALPYEKAEAIRMWNTRADLKTEPSNSENPNNCEPQTVLEAVLDRQTDEDRRKMAESVRKAIKDEPITPRFAHNDHVESENDHVEGKQKWTCARCGCENHADFKWCFHCGFHKPERSE